MEQERTHHFHLISDASGETIRALTRACLVQFDEVPKVEHHWSMVRTKRQLRPVLEGIEGEPGMVLYTLVNPKIREFLETECHRMQVPCISVLDPVMAAMGEFLKAQSKARPGQQHQLVGPVPPFGQ